MKLFYLMLRPVYSVCHKIIYENPHVLVPSGRTALIHIYVYMFHFYECITNFDFLLKFFFHITRIMIFNCIYHFVIFLTFIEN